MADNPWIIRAATTQDGSFLADMLLEAVNWSPEWKRRSRSRVLADPKTAHYIAGWPQEADLGVIAEADGEPIGAAWLRYLPATDPGYGFVSPDIPELTIGIATRWRGQGIGRALLRVIADRARQAGIGQISLSVERKNFARQLYLSEGYQIVDSTDAQSDTMVKDLSDDARPGHDGPVTRSPGCQVSPVGFGLVQRLPNFLLLATAGGRKPQQWHLVSIQDLVLECVSCPLVRVVLVEGEAVNFDGQQAAGWLSGCKR